MEAGAIPRTEPPVPGAALHPRIHAGGEQFDPAPMREQRTIGWLYGVTALALFGLMGLLGLTMRFNQAHFINISDHTFYIVLTMHGAGMIVTAVVAMMGAIWYFLRETVTLSYARVLWSYGLLVAGALTVLVAVLIGGFATGWTFLYPLPFDAAGQWSPWATVAFIVGLGMVASGFLVFCFDLVLQLIRRYGGIERAIGLAFLRDRDDDPPPPQAIAGLVVGIQGIVATGSGLTILVALLQRSFDDRISLNALWAKELTYMYGHSIANLTIYLAAGMLYALLPRYAGRPWKTTKPLVVGWLATAALVLLAFPHHLYMDFAQPLWLSSLGMVISSLAALPVAVVTIYTAMMLVWGSQYRWTLASKLLYLGFAGWAIGGTGAVIDSLIPVNFRFHDTLWVPAHFHTYMMLGVMFWAMAFVTYLLERAADRVSSRVSSMLAPPLLLAGGYGVIFVWFISGALGVPRRYADHFGGVGGLDGAGAVFALIFALGVLVVFIECARLALSARRIDGFRLATPAESAAIDAGRAIDLRAQPPLLTTRRQLMAAIAAMTMFLVAFSPAIDRVVEHSSKWHHLQHSMQFAFGMLLAIAVANTASFKIPRWRHAGSAIAVALLAPVLMMLAMAPGVYRSLESSTPMHAAYHLGIIALGIVTGWALTAFDRFTGWLYFVMAFSMAFIYAAGVGIGT